MGKVKGELPDPQLLQVCNHMVMTLRECLFVLLRNKWADGHIYMYEFTTYTHILTYKARTLVDRYHYKKSNQSR